MRRPVKPFVTEYRGGARRQGAQGQGAKFDPTRPDPTKLEPERSEPRTPAPWPTPQPRAAAQPQEDGYEAALRAADALFAARSQQPKAAGPVSAPSGEPPSSEASATTSPSPASGRILRAMDEPPSPELLRLEAEHAPKRRGRKPGSKNKPKLPVPAVEVAIEAAAAPVAIEPPPLLPMRTPVTALRAVSAPRPRSPAAAGPKVDLNKGDLKGERYAWVRTKLKPGQQWKQRRLPKVAW